MNEKKISTLKKIILLLLPTIIIASFALVFMFVHIPPTRVKIELDVSEFSFVNSGEKAINIISSKFKDVTFQEFKEINLSPEYIEMYIDFDKTKDIPFASNFFTLTSKDISLNPFVKIKQIPDQKEWQPYYNLFINPDSQVTLRQEKSKLYTIIHGDSKGNGLSPAAEVRVSEETPFQLITSNVTDNAGIEPENTSISYKIKLSESSPIINVEGYNGSLTSILKTDNQDEGEVFPKQMIAISKISFYKLDSQEGWLTTLLNDGSLSYPAVSTLKPVIINKKDYVSLDKLKKFSINEMGLNSESGGIKIVCEGIAGKIKIGTKDFAKDYRLTIFKVLWKNPILLILITIIGWAFSTTLSLYKIYNEYIKKK